MNKINPNDRFTGFMADLQNASLDNGTSFQSSPGILSARPSGFQEAVQTFFGTPKRAMASILGATVLFTAVTVQRSLDQDMIAKAKMGADGAEISQALGQEPSIMQTIAHKLGM